MGVAERKGRERALRESRIIEAARLIAAREGWSAVTIRRLAEEIEYSQPVLYSHFENRDAIVAAVAVEGFRDLATTLREADHLSTDRRTALCNRRHRISQLHRQASRALRSHVHDADRPDFRECGHEAGIEGGFRCAGGGCPLRLRAMMTSRQRRFGQSFTDWPNWSAQAGSSIAPGVSGWLCLSADFFMSDDLTVFRTSVDGFYLPYQIDRPQNDQA